VVWCLVATLVCGLFSHEGAKAQSFTNRFHAKLARGQRREEYVTSPFGGLRGLPLPYSLFLLSYYLFSSPKKRKGTKFPESVSRKARNGAKARLFASKARRHKLTRKFFNISEMKTSPFGGLRGLFSPS